VDPSIETTELGTGCVSLLCSLQQQDCARSWCWPAKQTWALLESNPRRNSRLKTHRNDGRREGPDTLSGSSLVHRTDSSSYASKNSCCGFQLFLISNGFIRCRRQVTEARVKPPTVVNVVQELLYMQ
jgi:hypothetical protein